jgi:hypothetical protein
MRPKKRRVRAKGLRAVDIPAATRKRFWKKVRKTRGCWLWIAQTEKDAQKRSDVR